MITEQIILAPQDKNMCQSMGSTYGNKVQSGFDDLIIYKQGMCFTYTVETVWVKRDMHKEASAL